MRKKGVNYAKYGYIFALPFVIAFVVCSLYPIIYTIMISFTDLKGMGNTSLNFLDNPLQNYQQVLGNRLFQTALKNTALIWLMNFVPQLLLGLVLAVWFTSRNYRLKGQGAFKVLFYMPNIITAATIAILFYSLFQYPTGPINDVLQTLGIIQEPVNFLQYSPWFARGIVAFIQFWMWYGYTMLILISGILGLNPELFEAAEMDGATSLQTFFKITLPNLRSIMLFMLVTSMIGGLQMFDIPKLFANGGPDNATLTTSLFIYNQAFTGKYFYARAAAASMILFAIIAVFASIIFYLMRDKDEIKARKLQRALEKSTKEERRSKA